MRLVRCYKFEMFKRHHLDNLSYPILLNDMNLYEDLILININEFSFVDDKRFALHPLVISRKNYERVAYLQY